MLTFCFILTKSQINDKVHDDFLIAKKTIQKNRKPLLSRLTVNYLGSIISVVGKTTVEIIELFECRQKVP